MEKVTKMLILIFQDVFWFLSNFCALRGLKWVPKTAPCVWLGGFTSLDPPPPPPQQGGAPASHQVLCGPWTPASWSVLPRHCFQLLCLNIRLSINYTHRLARRDVKGGANDVCHLTCVLSEDNLMENFETKL